MDKLTDSEIVKALEEYSIKYNLTYIGKQAKTIVDLINRLQAENKELKKELAKPILATKDLIVSFERIYRIGEEKALVQALKAEAYKEFAERLNKEAEKVVLDREGDFVEIDDKLYATVADWCKATSDNLLKELVGDTEEPPKPNWQDSMMNTFLGGKQ